VVLCGDTNKPRYKGMRVTKAGTIRHDLKCTKGCGYYVVTNAVWMQKVKADIEEKVRRS